MVGWAIKYLDLEGEDKELEGIFYPDYGVIQAGPALSLGLGTDVQLFRSWGLRFGGEYQPMYAMSEFSRNLYQDYSFKNDGGNYASLQSAEFAGEFFQQWRLTAGPWFMF